MSSLELKSFHPTLVAAETNGGSLVVENARGLLTRILGELDRTAFPLVVANQHPFELDGVRDVGESEGDGTFLCTVSPVAVEHRPADVGGSLTPL